MATPAFGAQAGTKAEPNNAALYDARRRQTNSGSQMIENIVAGSNCMAVPLQYSHPLFIRHAWLGRRHANTGGSQLTEKRSIDYGNDS